MPSIILDVANMIDLALGMPEMGVINFAMLHSVLHVLANEQKSLHQLVELRGVSVPSYLPKDTIPMIQTVQCKECYIKFDADQTNAESAPDYDEDVTPGQRRRRSATKHKRAEMAFQLAKQQVTKQRDYQSSTQQGDNQPIRSRNLIDGSSMKARKEMTGVNQVGPQSGRLAQQDSKGLSKQKHQKDVDSDTNEYNKYTESLSSGKSKRDEFNTEGQNKKKLPKSKQETDMDIGVELESNKGQSSELDLNYQPHGKPSRKKQAETEQIFQPVTGTVKTKQDVFVVAPQPEEQPDEKSRHKTRSPRQKTGDSYESDDQPGAEPVNDGPVKPETTQLGRTEPKYLKAKSNVNPQSNVEKKEINENLNNIKNIKNKSRVENDEISLSTNSENVEKRDQLVGKNFHAELEKQIAKSGGEGENEQSRFDRGSPKAKPVAQGTGKTMNKPKDEKLLIVERISKTSIDMSFHSKESPEDTISKKSDQKGLSIVSTKKFAELKKSVEEIQCVVMGKPPTNAEVIGDSRSRANKKTISDVWQSMNVASRLEATEKGVNQLTKIIQTLIDEKGEYAKNIAHDLNKLEAKLEIDICAQTKGLTNLDNRLIKFEMKCTCLTEDLDGKSQKMADMMDELSTAQHALSKLEFQMNGQMQVYDDDIEQLKEAIIQMTEEKEENIDVNSIVKDIKNLNEKSSELNERVDELHQTVVTVDCTFEEKHTQLSNMLQDEIEYLKCVKIDRYEIEDLVGDKADMSAINRLVSMDEYEANSHNVHTRLSTVEKDFEQQEGMWITKFNLLAQETDRKTDKSDVCALKDFVNDTYVHFHKNLNDLKKIIDENIVKSAATMKKLLRDVECITCDSNVMMMRKETNPLMPHQDPVMSIQSNAPAIHLELDKVRTGERNLENQPTRQHENWATITSLKVPRGSDSKHLCNRYCGGSHTLLIPKMRKKASINKMPTASQIAEDSMLSCACNCKHDEEQVSLDVCACDHAD